MKGSCTIFMIAAVCSVLLVLVTSQPALYEIDDQLKPHLELLPFFSSSSCLFEEVEEAHIGSAAQAQWYAEAKKICCHEDYKFSCEDKNVDNHSTPKKVC